MLGQGVPDRFPISSASACMSGWLTFEIPNGRPLAACEQRQPGHPPGMCGGFCVTYKTQSRSDISWPSTVNNGATKPTIQAKTSNQPMRMNKAINRPMRRANSFFSLGQLVQQERDFRVGQFAVGYRAPQGDRESSVRKATHWACLGAGSYPFSRCAAPAKLVRQAPAFVRLWARATRQPGCKCPSFR